MKKLSIMDDYLTMMRIRRTIINSSASKFQKLYIIKILPSIELSFSLNFFLEYKESIGIFQNLSYWFSNISGRNLFAESQKGIFQIEFDIRIWKWYENINNGLMSIIHSLWLLISLLDSRKFVLLFSKHNQLLYILNKSTDYFGKFCNK